MRPSPRTAIPIVFAITVIQHAVINGFRVVTVYRVIDVGGSAFEIGVAVALSAVGPVLGSRAIGRALDRGGTTAVYTVAATAIVVGCALTVVGGSLWVLHVGAFVYGIGHFCGIVTGQTLVARIATPDRVDRDVASWSLAVSIGQTIGVPGIALAFLEPVATAGWSNAVLLAFAGSAVLIIAPFAARLIQVPDPEATPPGEQTDDSTLALLKRRGMIPAVISSVLVLAGLDVLAAFLPVIGEERGMSIALVTVLLSVRSGASILSRLALPWIARLADRRVIIAICMTAAALAVALVPVVHDVPVLIGLMAIAGAGWGLAQPFATVWVVAISRPDQRGRALSLRMSATRVGQVILPWLGGALAAAAGASWVFMVLAVLLGISAAVSLREGVRG